MVSFNKPPFWSDFEVIDVHACDFCFKSRDYIATQVLQLVRSSHPILFLDLADQTDTGCVLLIRKAAE